VTAVSEPAGEVGVKDVLAELVRHVANHDQAIVMLQEAIGAASAEGAPGSDDGPAEVETADSPSFIQWVRWLADEFGLADVLGSDWGQIPGVVPELLALRNGHENTFDLEKPAKGLDQVYWHDALSRVASRIREARIVAAAEPEPRRPDPSSEEFRSWVQWLTGEFALSDSVGEDWANIPAVVDELWSLWRTYRDTFAAKTESRGIDEIYWYDAVARVAPRLRDHRRAAIGEPDEDQFFEWVEWLRRTYFLESSIGPKWPEVGPVVFELQALFKAYGRAFAPDAGGFEQVYWHDALARVLPRIEGYFKAHRKQQAG
jgi:hypothetical protein